MTHSMVFSTLKNQILGVMMVGIAILFGVQGCQNSSAQPNEAQHTESNESQTSSSVTHGTEAQIPSTYDALNAELGSKNTASPHTISNTESESQAKNNTILEQKSLHGEDIYTVGYRTETLILEVNGEMAASESVKIGSEIGGKIEAISVEVGDSIKKGQTLAQLSNATLDSQLLQINQQIEQLRFSLYGNQTSKGELRAQLELVENQVEFAQENLHRFQPLQDRAISQSDLEQIENQAESAYLQLQLTQAQKQSMHLKLHHAMEQREDLQSKIQKLKIIAPFSGVVQQRLKSLGDFLNPAPMDAIMVIQQINPLHLRIQIPEYYAITINRSDSILELEIPTIMEDTIRIDRIIPMVDTRSRSIALEADIPNSNHQLFPGMFIEGLLHIQVTGLFVPENAICNGETLQPYLTRIEEGVSHKQEVHPGIEMNGFIQVLRGISENDTISLSCN